MQQYTEILATHTLANSREKITNNDKTIMSCNSGTTFPTTDLQVGMLCLRTDLKQLFELEDLAPTWTIIADLNKTYTNKEYVDAHINATTGIHGATSANTASRIVQRDASGNFIATTITAALNGNASTATKLATARTITLAGDVTGSVAFDGSGNVTITCTSIATQIPTSDVGGNFWVDSTVSEPTYTNYVTTATTAQSCTGNSVTATTALNIPTSNVGGNIWIS